LLEKRDLEVVVNFNAHSEPKTVRVIKSARRIAAGAPVTTETSGVAASSSLILMGQSVQSFERCASFQSFHRFCGSLVSLRSS
jgi:hypothetical protein